MSFSSLPYLLLDPSTVEANSLPRNLTLHSLPSTYQATAQYYREKQVTFSHEINMKQKRSKQTLIIYASYLLLPSMCRFTFVFLSTYVYHPLQIVFLKEAMIIGCV